MSLRVTILAGLAILGIGLLAVWQFAPSVFAEARSLLEPERLETLVARAGLWGPVLIVTLMTIAVVASPIPSAPIALAAGAAYAGARALVTMKQVGLNVASDPLMSLSYIGVKGGMVVLVADDPGPISSQTEQDTRHFAQYAHLPIFDPASPEDAYRLIGEAFAYSEKYHTPVIFRPTTQICHACASIEADDVRLSHAMEGFVK